MGGKKKPPSEITKEGKEIVKKASKDAREKLEAVKKEAFNKIN